MINHNELICDFVGGPFGYRIRHGKSQYHALAKAVGFKGKKNLNIIDATAGLGRDAFLLASLGANVTLIERNTKMHKLLEDPPRRKTALVKKELRIIRDIVGTDPDAKKLMDTALENSNSRVVLKWPRKAEPMVGLPSPSHQIVGKTTRYDVFIQT